MRVIAVFMMILSGRASSFCVHFLYNFLVSYFSAVADAMKSLTMLYHYVSDSPKRN